MKAPKRDWRELCEAASEEQNSEKLETLISELLKTLEERNVSPQSAYHDDSEP